LPVTPQEAPDPGAVQASIRTYIYFYSVLVSTTKGVGYAYALRIGYIGGRAGNRTYNFPIKDDKSPLMLNTVSISGLLNQALEFVLDCGAITSNCYESVPSIPGYAF
jgi:hypothetical protein